jgi:hypothetical protein
MTSSISTEQEVRRQQDATSTADPSQLKIISRPGSSITSYSSDSLEERRAVEKLIEEMQQQENAGFTGSLSFQLPRLMKMVLVVALPVTALIVITGLQLAATINDHLQVGTRLARKLVLFMGETGLKIANRSIHLRECS